MRPRLARSALLALLGFLTPLLTVGIWWSWGRTAALVTEQGRQSLGFQARIVGSRLADSLHDAVVDTETQARNPVVINAIADGADQSAALLAPLIKAQSERSGRRMTVASFNGRPLWPPAIPADLAHTALVADTIRGGVTRTVLDGGDLLIIAPVHYRLTNSDEGAVVVTISLKVALEDVNEGLTAATRLDGPAGWLVGSLPGPAVLESVHPIDHPAVANLGLRVIASRPLAEVEDPVAEQLRAHVLVGLVMLAVIAMGTSLVIRRLTRRLERLAASTTAAGDPSAVPDLGHDEVGDLARTLRTLLTDLSTARTDLEAQVDLRTGQLKDALVLGRMGSWTFEVNEGVFVFNDELYAIYATTAVAQGGYRLTPAQYAERFLPPEVRPLLATSQAEILASPDVDRIWDLDHPMIRADGSLGEIAVRLRVVRDADGRPRRIVGVNQDITARKQLETDLAQARDAADLANRAKSSFLATMSHEIRTPLNGVIGMANLLDAMTLTPEQREMVTTITASGRHLLTVINDILDFSKIEAGRFDLESIPFSLPGMVTEVVSLLGSTAEAKKLNLAVVVDPTVPEHLLGDPGRLRQILTNLIGNGLKFTDRGGVMVQVLPTRLEESHVDLTLRIEDSGVGIPSDRLADLFQPFVQTDASITRRFGGTGLGLVISRRLAELMGGTITVVSTLGQGTTFTVQIRLPLAPAGGRAIPAPESGSSIGRPSRILLVEDNRVNQRVATLLLQHLGHTVLIANDGREALDILAREPVQMVLMDCQMPVMDGFTATRALRDPATPVLNHRVPIIALTANAMQGDREDCLAAGMDDFLTKPLETSALIAALARWLPA